MRLDFIPAVVQKALMEDHFSLQNLTLFSGMSLLSPCIAQSGLLLTVLPQTSLNVGTTGIGYSPSP